MSENIIKTKSFNFALRIVKLFQFLNQEKKEYVLSKQLLRSGTAIGALVRESEQAESKLDFIHKLAIAQKGANESDYWLELLFQSEYLNETQFQSLKNDIIEINKILASIIITTKQKIRKNKRIIKFTIKMNLHIKHNSQFTIHHSQLKLSGSKSETNRLLLLQALYPTITLENASNSEDSEVMSNALHPKRKVHNTQVVDVHHAGTAMRFLTAFLPFKKGEKWL